jgi:outer membrane protein TolC
MNRILLLSRGGLLAASIALAWPAAAASLPEVMRQVLQQHPDVRSSQAVLNIAAERGVQARSNFYPTLGLSAAAADAKDYETGVPRDRTTRTADAFMRWNLFRGLGDRQASRTAEFDQQAANADLDAVQEQVALQVVQAYLDVLRLRQLSELSERYIAEYRRLGEDVRKRANAGRVAAADMDQVRASLIQAQLQQSQMRGQLRGAEERYRLLTGALPGELSEPVLDDSAAQMSLDALMEQALAGNSRVQGALRRAAARGEEIGVADAGLLPSLDLEVRKRLHSEIDPVPQVDTRQSTQLQFSYQMPLGGASFSRKREAVERKLAAQATADSELLRARGELVERWTAWREVREIAPSLAERVEANEKVVKAYDLQFAAARRAITDLIAARGEHYRARTDVLENRMEQLASSAQVLSLLGRLRQSVLVETAALNR